METLSVKQPWADLIASGKKTIETRKWRTKYRGPLLIASSRIPPNKGLAGVTVCLVELLDCRLMNSGDEEDACLPYNQRHKLYAWVLGSVQKVEPMPIKGQLKIFNSPISKGELVFCD